MNHIDQESGNPFPHSVQRGISSRCPSELSVQFGAPKGSLGTYEKSLKTEIQLCQVEEGIIVVEILDVVVVWGVAELFNKRAHYPREAISAFAELDEKASVA